MTVKFKFDYTLNFHNRYTYIKSIESDGESEENALKLSLVSINKGEIKSIEKTSDGAANIILKRPSAVLTTVEEYNEVIETIQKANIALKIMQNEKVYIFDEFEVDSDELNIVDGWTEMVKKTTSKKRTKK